MLVTYMASVNQKGHYGFSASYEGILVVLANKDNKYTAIFRAFLGRCFSLG